MVNETIFNALPQNVSDSHTMNVVVSVVNFCSPEMSMVNSYTLPTENIAPSRALDEGAVRVGDSLINARVPESRIRRDRSEEF